MNDILHFWFGDPPYTQQTYAERRKLWFGKNPEVDCQIRDRLLETYHQASSGVLKDWRDSPHGCLALILVLDQFPRNMFRDQPQAFATDHQARTIAETAIAQGFDQELAPVERVFLYLPLEHSENLAHQNQCVALMQTLSEANPELQDVFDYALRHRAVIERFGRFPHRNRILGRENTIEETEFLQQPGSSF